MKEYYARLPFGTEQRLNLGFGNTCPACDVVRGSLHEFGCMAEECPKCHRPVVSCYCECLQPKDTIRIIMAIEKTFTCLDDAFNAGAGVGKRNAETLTPTDSAAIGYVMNNVPPELKKEFDQGFLEQFPELKPCGTDQKGKPVYSTKDIAKVLGVDVAEINETAAAMAGEDSGLCITAINSTNHRVSTMTENTDRKQKPHLYKKGQSGNPKGKPPGSRNKATMAALALLEGEASALTRKAVELALAGDIQALRLCLERIVAPTKDRPILVSLPAVETAADMPKITAALLAAVAAGEVGATEAATIGRLVEAHGKAIETADFEARLKKIEEAQR